jgi:hypothetical protein
MLQLKSKRPLSDILYQKESLSPLPSVEFPQVFYLLNVQGDVPYFYGAKAVRGLWLKTGGQCSRRGTGDRKVGSDIISYFLLLKEQSSVFNTAYSNRISTLSSQ